MISAERRAAFLARVMNWGRSVLGLTVDGGSEPWEPLTDDEYRDFAARHEAAGLPVPPRWAATRCAPGQYVTAWAGGPTAEGSEDGPSPEGSGEPQ